MNKLEQKYDTGEYMRIYDGPNCKRRSDRDKGDMEGGQFISKLNTDIYCYRKRNGIRDSHLDRDAAVMPLVHIFSV
jgi:hypothetical protein